MKTAAAYIFDFDGTLADTSDLMVESKMDVCQQMGIPKPDEDLIRAMGGMNVEDTFVLATGIDDVAIRREAVEWYNALFLERTLADLRLFPETLATLTELRSRGAKIGVMSLRLPADLDKLMRSTGLDRYVDAWIAEKEVRRPKPAPDMILNLTERFGVKPDQTYVVGDTIYDLEIAANAGAGAVGVTFGVQTASFLERQNPVAIISSLSELL